MMLQTMEKQSRTQHQPGQSSAGPEAPGMTLHPHVSVELIIDPATPKITSSIRHVSVEPLEKPRQPLVAPPTPKTTAARHVTATPLLEQQQKKIKEVDIEPQLRGRHEISAKEAATRLPQGGQIAPESREDWFSKLIEHLWPRIRKVTEDISWETVPPILEESKPSWVHSFKLHKFTLGQKEPDVRDIRCFVDEEDVMDDVFIEMDLEWNSKIDVELELQVLGKDVSSFVPNFIEEQLAKLFRMVVGVEDVTVKGTLQIAMRPLLYRLPIVQAMQIGFTEMPREFEFTPTLEGGPLGNALNTLLPSIKSWLKSTVNEAIWMPYVLPEHYFYPLEENAPDLQRPLGVMHCRVVEATYIPRMDFFGAGSDTFVECYVRHTQRNKTSVISGTHPIWKNEAFVMPLHSKQHQKLKFALFDYDALTPNDEIGRSEVAILDLPEGQTQDLWLDVYNESEEEQHAAKNGQRGIQYSRGERVLRALAKPFAGHSTKKTQLHVRVHWRTWTDEETQFIKHAMKHGIRKAVISQQGLDPGLREMLLSGAVHVAVQQCRGLNIHGFLQRPSVKMVVRVGNLEPQETPPFKVSRRGNADLSTALVQINVAGDVAGHEDTDDDVMVRIDIQKVGFLRGNDVVGSFAVPLVELIDKGCISGEKKLRQVSLSKGPSSRQGNARDDTSSDNSEKESSAKVEIRWVGNFA